MKDQSAILRDPQISWIRKEFLRCAGLLALMALVLIAVRIHTYDEPFERDIVTYAVYGHEMLQGRELYSELWDNKPPGIFIAYALAEKLVGYGNGAIFLLNVFFALSSLLAIFFTGFVLNAVP